MLIVLIVSVKPSHAISSYRQNPAMSAVGVWANLVCGYGGMRSDGTVLSFRPQIARVWNHYQFRVNYQGAVIDVVVENTGGL